MNEITGDEALTKSSIAFTLRKQSSFNDIPHDFDVEKSVNELFEGIEDGQAIDKMVFTSQLSLGRRKDTISTLVDNVARVSFI